MFDSHCHLDAEEYDGDRDAVLARARAAGVRGIMVPGYTPDEWTRLGPLCAAHRGIVCAVGLHPLYVHDLDERTRSDALARLEPLLRELRARAVGECGLDAPVARKGGADLETQSAVVDAHLELARSLELPVILHCVRAHGRMLDLLERHGRLPRGGVMHAYGGPVELIDRYARLGFSFSFGGIVTHVGAKKPRLALTRVPLSRLLVETDGPSQVPAGSQRPRSEPADVAKVLAVAAELRGESVSLLAARTWDNTLGLFGCDPAHFPASGELLA